MSDGSPIKWVDVWVEGGREFASYRASDGARYYVPGCHDGGICPDTYQRNLRQARLISRAAAIQLSGLRQLKDSHRKLQGFVYGASDSTRPDILKIGCSNNPEKRVRSFENRIALQHSVFQYKLEWFFSHPDQFLAEAKLHLALENRRVAGEWFLIRSHEYRALSRFAGKVMK